MKIVFCTIPIRSNPDPFPPVACTALCNALIKKGYDPVFYDINAKRPSEMELREYFKKEKYDMVGISAVVSTAYSYVKKLSNIIKEVSPNTSIVLGGNMAAAYDVILNKCSIDLCAVGEGEKIIVNLVKHLEKHKNFKPNEDFKKIKGIIYKEGNGMLCFTGYETPIPSEEIAQPDYDLLKKYSSIDSYILDPMARYDFICDERTFEAKRKGQKMATIFTSKGCVNQCTFCHRWVKGYRVIPAGKVIETMRYLKEKYNAGCFCISDECFGESKKWLEDFIGLIRPLDVLFQVGGARISVIKDDPSIIKRLKEVGLTAIYFGMESGSNKILKIMEKNATNEENLEAAKICANAGVYTVIQMVVGMPGENETTINETIEFLKAATEIIPYPVPVSTNYLQALPGTPTYDFLKYHSFLGNDLNSEEKYLLSVSDINASDFRQYVNVTEEHLSKVSLWQSKITISVAVNWFKKHGWKIKAAHPDALVRNNEIARKTSESYMSVFSIKSMLLFRAAAYLGKYFWKIKLFLARVKLYGVLEAILITLGLTEEKRIKPGIKMDSESLRKYMDMRMGANSRLCKVV